MTAKTISIVSYITIIGWIIAYVNYNNSAEKSSLGRFHLKQSLGVAIFSIIVGIALTIVASIVPALASILSIMNLAILILWIFGIINASNEQEKAVPVIGGMFENKFDFIKA